MTDLIRYPLTVMAGVRWKIVDASGLCILCSTDDGFAHAAEVVRVMNEAWEGGEVLRGRHERVIVDMEQIISILRGMPGYAL